MDVGGIVVPLRLASPWGTLSFISTTTVFGTPLDVTLGRNRSRNLSAGRRDNRGCAGRRKSDYVRLARAFDIRPDAIPTCCSDRCDLAPVRADAADVSP
jgi:hypothetical protein